MQGDDGGRGLGRAAAPPSLLCRAAQLAARLAGALAPALPAGGAGGAAAARARSRRACSACSSSGRGRCSSAVGPVRKPGVSLPTARWCRLLPPPALLRPVLPSPGRVGSWQVWRHGRLRAERGWGTPRRRRQLLRCLLLRLPVTAKLPRQLGHSSQRRRRGLRVGLLARGGREVAPAAAVGAWARPPLRLPRCFRLPRRPGLRLRWRGPRGLRVRGWLLLLGLRRAMRRVRRLLPLPLLLLLPPLLLLLLLLLPLLLLAAHKW